MNFNSHFQILADISTRLTQPEESSQPDLLQWVCTRLMAGFSDEARIFGLVPNGNSTEELSLGSAGALQGSLGEEVEVSSGKWIEERLLAGRSPMGRLILRRGPSAPSFSEEDRQLIRVLAIQLGCFLERSKQEWGRRRLQVIADVIPMLVTYIDKNLIYRFNNRHYDEWFGIPHGSIGGKSLQEVLGDDGYALVKPWAEQALQGKSVVFERMLRHSTKGVRLVQVHYAPDFSLTGEVLGFVAAVRDITDERSLQQDLQKAVQTRDDFLVVAAHELRTPLTCLKLQVQTAERLLEVHDVGRENIQERVRSLLGAMNGQVRRFSTLIDSLLDVSQISAGILTLQPKHCDLGVLVQRVADQLSPQFRGSGCDLVVGPLENIADHWDPVRLEQVVENLLSNALKYGLSRPVHVRVLSQNNDAILEVEDQGIGIDPEKHEKIFHRFERAVGHRNISGLGLGLFIVSEILKAHQGTISVESAPGRGSVFRATIPRGKLQ